MTLVQPILIAKTASHQQAIVDAARASVAAYFADQDNPLWEQWLDGPHTKTVRRAPEAKVAQSADLGYSIVESASAGLPVTYEDMPRLVRNLQVSGTIFPRVDLAGDGPLLITVDTALTTGKAAAQAAHAAWAWLLDTIEGDPETIADWQARGLPIRLALTDAVTLHSLPGLRVIDNGLTEIEPNTLTAVASRWRPV